MRRRFCAAVVIVSRVVLGWLHYDRAEQKVMSEKIGDGVLWVVIYGMFIGGLVLIVRRAISALRSKRAQQPPLLSDCIAGPQRPRPSKRHLPQ